MFQYHSFGTNNILKWNRIHSSCYNVLNNFKHTLNKNNEGLKLNIFYKLNNFIKENEFIHVFKYVFGKLTERKKNVNRFRIMKFN